MRVKLVVRLLDASGALLAWTPLRAEARGDRRLWPMDPCVLGVERAGVPATLSIHWPDLNVQTVVPAAGPALAAGQVVTRAWADGVMAFDSDEGPLPPVTVRTSVAVSVPVGALSQ